MRAIVRRACIAYVVLLLLPTAASAQQPDAVEPTGMVGSAFAATTWLSLPQASTKQRGGGGLRIGFRARTSRSPGWNRIRWGLDGSVIVTDLEGMNPEKDPFAFSSADVGPALSVRVAGHLRTYAHLRFGKQTMELAENDQIWNYAAGGAANLGLGLELPLTPEGRGVDVAIHYLRGEFGSRERLGILETGTRVRYHAWRVALGWSGPMTISAPWR